MAATISGDHPLRALFHDFVENALARETGTVDPGVARYLGDVLVDFTHRDQLFRIRDAGGKPLEEVAEMLVEGDVSLNATSFNREREVHKHIGDYTLFWTGLYPEMLRYLRASQRTDHLLDYVDQGRRSYWIASTFRHDPYGEEAEVLGRLSQKYEACMVGLHAVRRELDTYGTPEMTAVRRLLQA